MPETRFLSRFSGPTRLGQLLTGFSPDLPDVIAVACDDTIEHAIEVLRFHEISQVPVVRTRQNADGIEIHVREDSPASREGAVIAIREAVRSALGREDVR